MPAASGLSLTPFRPWDAHNRAAGRFSGTVLAPEGIALLLQQILDQCRDQTISASTQTSFNVLLRSCQLAVALLRTMHVLGSRSHVADGGAAGQTLLYPTSLVNCCVQCQCGDVTSCPVVAWRGPRTPGNCIANQVTHINCIPVGPPNWKYAGPVTACKHAVHAL